MNPTTHLLPTWTLNHTLARLNSSCITACVDAAHPERGIQELSFDRCGIDGSILRLCRSKLGDNTRYDAGRPTYDWPLVLSDVYVRDNDLVASYQPNDDWPYAPQVYWRADPFADIDWVPASLEVLVAIQTHLLDTRPAISIATSVLSEDRIWIAVSGEGQTEVTALGQTGPRLLGSTATCVIQRLPKLPLSYVEIVPTTDCCALAVVVKGRESLALEWRLFSDFLEKGVIRKARVFAAILPTANDIELAIECCAAIEQSPLPLTT